MTEQSRAPGPEEIRPEEIGPEEVDPEDAVVEDAVPEDDAPDAAGAESPIRTGLPSVDAVLAEIDELDELPLDQHLARFERAHDTLRSALDAPTGPAADDPA
ncbi:hypothetical protein [Nocardioides cynanchi]|uniref:hypothetical protein n=1 Tax=Nocardioides cynanchi TaxID=2558918 RepID=UPI00124531EF|nr:hypothetical protein [Nocardioides cynanchi]